MDLSPQAEALAALTVETRLLFRALRRAADDLHAVAPWHTAARRSVLVELFEEGPRTVPDLARARHVSRQDIQTRVNRLAEEGLVEIRPNPAHKRSHLVALTSAGEGEVAALREREAGLLDALAPSLDAAAVREAAAVLADLRHLLDARASGATQGL